MVHHPSSYFLWKQKSSEWYISFYPLLLCHTGEAWIFWVTVYVSLQRFLCLPLGWSCPVKSVEVTQVSGLFRRYAIIPSASIFANMLFFKKKSSRAMKQTSSESTATAETVPRCRSSPTPQESEQPGTKTAATRTPNEQIARDWVLAMQNHDRSRLHDITDLGGVFLMRDAVAGELEYRIDDLYDIFSNFWASVPDCDYECGRIYESSPNEVVLEGLCWFGHHTGKAFPFEPNPAIEPTGKFVRDGPLECTFTIKDGRIIRTVTKGNNVGPHGTYEKLGGFLI